MLWKSILTNFFTPENTKILSKTALESTEFTKLNQYKALTNFAFYKAKGKKNLALFAVNFFSRRF